MLLAPAVAHQPPQRRVAVGQRLRLGGKTIEELPAQHTVPAVGYAVEGHAGWWVYTGDTGPNPALWPLLADRRVEMLVIETAFSDREQELARISQHLSPASLADQLDGLSGEVPVYLTHAKPGEMERIAQEVRALPVSHTIRHLEAGQVYVV